MLKTYLRYESSSETGVIASSRSNSLLVGQADQIFAITPAYDSALCWDIMKGELRARYKQRKDMDGEVTCLGIYIQNKSLIDIGVLVIGRMRGRVDLHEFRKNKPNEPMITQAPRASLLGHSSAVTFACFNEDGSRLATASKDTFIVIWDPIAETGLFRLRGHKDEITCLKFCSLQEGHLISSSKDTTIKIWNLDGQYCSKTFADHSAGVWCFDFSEFDSSMPGTRKRLLAGSSDGLVRSFDLSSLKIMPGPVNRQTSERAETLAICHNILVIQSSGRVIEFHRIRSEERMNQKHKRRLKRLREKSKEITEEEDSIWTQDEIELACVLRTSSTTRSVAIFLKSSSAYESEHLVLVSLTNNLVELYSLKTTLSQDEEEEEYDDGPKLKKKKRSRERSVSTLEIKTRLELQGHRADIRYVALGDDDELTLTAADGALKLWNTETGTCLRTIKTGFALCCAFIPNTLRAVVGTKEESLTMFNLNDGSIQKDIPNTHEGGVFSIDIRPDGRAMVSCGGDKTCKFWDFKTSPEEGYRMVNSRTLKLGEDAQCVRYTRGALKSDQLKVCVAMLDGTVKIFHEDSLQFFLSLYGHKLPVLTMDSSDDGTLLVTGSADKTIKVWGLDFGDCHRSVFAHEGSVTCVRFVPKTHYILSTGRDGRVRYWDCDSNLDRILNFEKAHFGDAWGLAVSQDASFFVSVGKDRRIRRYNRTRDLVFIDEEKAKEMELKIELEEEQANNQEQFISANQESISATKKTMESIEASDRLIQLLDQMASNTDEEEDEDQKLTRLGVEVAKACRSTSPQDLQDALIFFPMIRVIPLLISFAYALRARVEVELIAKSALSLIKTHGGRLGNVKDRDALEFLQKHLREAVWELRDLMGTNLAGLRWYGKKLDIDTK